MEPEKFCPHCETTKPVSEFYKDPRHRDGLGSWCKSCVREASAKRHAMRTPEHHRASHLWTCYRLRPEDWEALYIVQGKKCAGCGKKTRQLQVDHDHACCPGGKSCGKCVRGLLCKTCNTRRLPMIEGSHHLVEALTAYLAVPPAYKILRRRDEAA